MARIKIEKKSIGKGKCLYYVRQYSKNGLLLDSLAEGPLSNAKKVKKMLERHRRLKK